MRKLLKEWRTYLNEEMTDQEKKKLELGNELIRLRGPDGFEKNYHMPDFEEFFRVVKSIEKYSESPDELYDAYMFAKRSKK